MTHKGNGIVIVGGGIGGLTMALALHNRGISSRVYEAATEFQMLGLGINLMPHAIRVLTSLGLSEMLQFYGVEAREFTYFNRHGQLIFFRTVRLACWISVSPFLDSPG
jgi:2-polyprenyl-6-methoxyphenol hydroxylase-like FAD-dependent oxidoreductase